MATIYCEFCGEPANKKVQNAERLIQYIHNVGKNVVRCENHRRTSKMIVSCRTHDPLTGARK